MPDNKSSLIAASADKQLTLGARSILGVAQGLTAATAAILAYLPARALGLQEGFWGAITAIAVVQSEFAATETSGRDQLAGAAVGGLVGAAVVSWTGQLLAGYALAVIASMTVCWLLKIPSAARLAGITSTIIALVPHHTTVERMVVARVTEVAWGAIVALIVVWVVHRVAQFHRRSPSAP